MTFRAKKSLGQNFLTDRNILHAILSAADVQKEDTVIEVGPGKGILTKELALKAKHVITIEKDRRLIPTLQNIFSSYWR